MTVEHYATLDVAPTATAAEVRAAYLKLLRAHHPDRNPSPKSAERTQGIIAAFKVLGDFDRRSRYDWDRRRDREAAEAVAAPRPVSRTALAAGAMAIVALGGLWLNPGSLHTPPSQPATSAVISAPAITANRPAALAANDRALASSSARSKARAIDKRTDQPR